MNCPKCGHEQNNDFECESCGIIFEKYAHRQKELENINISVSTDNDNQASSNGKLYTLAGIILLCILIYIFLPSSDMETPSPVSAVKIPLTAISENSTQGIARQLEEAFPPKNFIEKARNATVFVQTAWGIGSGFFIDSTCNIITNRHVVEFDPDKLETLRTELGKLERFIEYQDKYISDAEIRAADIHRDPPEWFTTDLRNRKEQLRKAKEDYETVSSKLDDIEYGFESREYKIILVDGTKYNSMDPVLSEKHDLAFLKISETDCPYIRTGNSIDLEQGEKIYTIGNPAGMAYTVTSGIFSGYQKVNGFTYLQTDAPINPGNSGGPMIDNDGKVIGINTWRLIRAKSLGFAIPIETAVNELKQSAGN